MSEKLRIDYKNMGWWESYQRDIMVEYRQSIEEGLDIEGYKELFEAVSKMPDNEYKDKACDLLFNIVLNSQIKTDYKYNEPSTLEEIKALREKYKLPKRKIGKRELEKKIYGAWLGRVAGCLLGKPVEGIQTDELHKLLKSSDNYPMKRYIKSTDITDEMVNTFRYNLRGKCWADNVKYMPYDDDTNYTVMGQILIERFGKDITPLEISNEWLKLQPKESYCTAERIAYKNFLIGYKPPYSAIYKNPFREWIGAQIRGDYFGYLYPAKPEKSAELAFRDASISHIKNGIYGEMFASAMISASAVCNTAEEIILAGLGEIPKTSRLYEDVMLVLNMYREGKAREECYDLIHTMWDERDNHHWCHTISNAMIVAYALLYGEDDFGKSICLAVESAFDTDCNGATVGSIMGMKLGADVISDEWKKPFNDTIETTLIGVGTVKIKDLVKKTIEQINK